MKNTECRSGKTFCILRFAFCILVVRLVTSAATCLILCVSEAAEPGRVPFREPVIAPASGEAESALKQYRIQDGYQLRVYAAEPLLAHPVAFAIDEKNRVYVSESFRVGEQVTDIRQHMNWLEEELASTNTAQLRQLITKYLGGPRSLMTSETERIQLLEDTNSDGVADKSTVYAEGFNDIDSGIASGVLSRKGDVWFTCIPDLWRLRDGDGDGKADERHILQHGYAVRFGFYGHDLHGLRFGPDGKVYFSIGDRGLNVVTPEGRRVAAPESGSVLRCNLDGSELELFATGLRNPQELAFDELGNLFTGDNNSDGGDEARWVYLVEGSDSGWRIGYQFISAPVSRGPWNAEKMWRPQNSEQPAFIIPPITNLAAGPSGLTYSPGTGLPPGLERHFFLCDFRGAAAQSFVHSFALKPRGASFEVTDARIFLSGMLVTDVDFGMDGAIYFSDWVEGWGKTGKGRIYRADHPEFATNALVRQTRQLMASGFEQRKSSELIDLLNWPDQRVRQEAQFELAARGLESASSLANVARHSTNLLARVHAIWALGQIHRAMTKRDRKAAAEALAPVASLLEDMNGEIQAQAARVLGDAKYSDARRRLAMLAADPQTPARVQFFATMALGKIGLGKIGGLVAIDAVIELLRNNADRDPYLRHAGVMALFWLTGSRPLQRAVTDKSPAVRMGALLAQRRSGSPFISQFLKDSDPRLVLEAARAICDLPIDGAMPELAALAQDKIESPVLLQRVINANFRVGTREAANALAKLATDSSTPESGRVAALMALGQWAKPSGIDHVTGLWRPLPERSGAAAIKAIRESMAELLVDRSEKVRIAAAELAGRSRLTNSIPMLVEQANQEGGSPEVRAAALRALAALNAPQMVELLEKLLSSKAEGVRIEATTLLAKLRPQKATELLSKKIESGTTGEKQMALMALGKMNGQAVDGIISQELDRLLAGKADHAIELELLEAASNHVSPEILSRLARFEDSRPKNELAKYVEALYGGNAQQGRKIFFEKPAASCTRCHKLQGVGGEVGPDLAITLTNRPREYLLESIVAPNKTIAPGFENLMIVLKNGTSYVGVLKSESETELVINSPEDGLVTVAKADIASRKRGLSGMQADLAELLSKRDLRDLVEFLATLRPQGK